MFLKIDFRSEGLENCYVYYKLLNNSVVDKFIEIINKANSEVDVKAKYNSVSIDCGIIEELILDKYTSLMNNISKFESENNNGAVFENKFSLQDISQENLNKLHEEFEKYIIVFFKQSVLTNVENKHCYKIEKEFNKVIIDECLNNVNNLIHGLESLLGSKHTSNYFCQGFFSSSLINEKAKRKMIKLEDEEFKLFNVDYCYGDLLLGYGTTGKSLYHIFKDNDLSILEKGIKPSPQMYVTTNILGIFKDKEEYRYERFKDWFIKNDIGKFGLDFYDNRNSHGYIKLGDLVCNIDKNKFLIDLSKYKTIAGYEICKEMD